MTTADEKKTRQIFADLVAPHLIMQANDVKQTNIALLHIEEHLEKINGSLGNHEKVINENLPHTIANCAQKDTIQEIRDNMITTKAVKKAVILGIGLTSTIIGIIFTILEKLFNIN